MAKPEFGTKRQCQSCGTKFYDLGRDPILCPKCGTLFQPVALRSRPEPVSHASEEEPEAAEAVVEVISLDEAAAEESKDAIADDDLDIEDDIEADDTFLEEEEEGDDDVSTLIDGDLENDEET